MRDWKAIAKAHGSKIPNGELEKATAPLDEVEEILRSLVPDLTPGIEPAFDVRLEPGE